MRSCPWFHLRGKHYHLTVVLFSLLEYNAHLTIFVFLHVCRDLAEFGMGMNVPPPPIMSREEFEARKADLKRKRESERRGER